MTSAWLSYVPQHVAQDLLDHPARSPLSGQQRFDAVALFADVSGFTAMSEALGKSGKAGTEELTRILNSYFEPMIALVESYGGIIGKFGGDAMTILFPYAMKVDAPNAARRATQCALEMQARMVDYASIPTSGGIYGLTMKAGLAVGPVLCTNVGDPALRLEYLIAGKVLDDCADAEHHATKGEVVVHDGLLPLLGGVQIVERRDGFTCIGKLTLAPPLQPLAKPEHAAAAAIPTLAAYLHPAIAERVRAGQSAFINEHRKVTVLFVRFSGFDYDHDPSVALKLQAYLAAVIRVIHRYDGYLNKVDMGDKGSKYIALFGAPLAHEDDEERALRCALELAGLPGATVRIGVNTGFVYCGQVGSPARQEYTVMGDVVNLAARLMGAAQDGEILTTPFTRRPVEPLFAWGEFVPMQFKGKSEPIPVCTVEGVRQDARAALHAPLFNLPMVGRAAELARIQAKISTAAAGHGQIIGLTAEAGMGKSRLAAEVVRLAALSGMVSFAGECQSFGTATSYLVWSNIWRDLFGLDAAAAPEAQLAALRAALSALNPQFLARLPLLGPLLNLDIPDTPLTEQLDAKVRNELRVALLIDALRLMARARPLLLVLEDCHWIDPLSTDLLIAVARNITDLPVGLLMVYRPLGPGKTAFDTLRRFPHFTEIALTEFTPDEAARLISLKLTQATGTGDALPEALVARITARAGGNPFYIEELLNLIHDRGIDPHDSAALENLELPDSLHSLIISRIDQLAEREKLTIKVASIIGRLFKARWLWGSAPDLGEPGVIQRHLIELSSLEFTLQEKPEPELEYLFKHAVTQEVAYESLAYATRQTLHGQIARYIETAYGRDLRPYIYLLAHHYGHSQEIEKQRDYFRLAGDLAKASYANEAAVGYYQRLRPLLPPESQPDIMRALGDIWQLTGDWEAAEAIYREALALSETVGDARGAAWCRNALGYLLMFTASPADAQPVLEAALTTFEALSDRVGQGRTLKFLSIAHIQQGNLDLALSIAARGRALAEAVGDQIGLSEADMNLAWAYRDLGDFAQSFVYLEEALAICESAGYSYGVFTALNDTAGTYFGLGQYAEALAHCLRAYQVATTIGYLDGAGGVIQNIGEIYAQEGDYDSALVCNARALAINRQLGNQVGVLFALNNIANIMRWQGALDRAVQRSAEAERLGRALNYPFVLCETLQGYAEVLATLGDLTAAAAKNAEAREIAAQIQRAEIHFRADLLALRLRHQAGALTTADYVAALLALASDETLPEAARAQAIFIAWEAAPDHDELRARADDVMTDREGLRARAREANRALYAAAPNRELYARLRALGEADLAAPPALPPPPEGIIADLPDLDALLAVG